MAELFTKKHYDELSRLLVRLRPDMHAAAYHTLVGELALFFTEDNDKFDTVRWLSACGVGELPRNGRRA